MRFINKLNNSSKQSFTLIGEAGESISFNLYFLPSQKSWFFDISYNDFIVKGMRLCAAPNLLRCFKNNISFGLACVSLDEYDPNSLNDFTAGRIQIFTLNAAEVLQVESDLFT